MQTSSNRLMSTEQTNKPGPFIYKNINLHSIGRRMLDCFELVCVAEGTKPLLRMKVSDVELKVIKKFCLQTGLHIKVGDYRVISAKGFGTGNYTNRALLIKSKKKKGHFHCFIAKDPSLLSYDFLKISDRSLGGLLGYPECCLDYYERTRAYAECHQRDFVFPGLDSLYGSVYSNFLLRYFGFSTISHFPCSLSCMATIAIGKRNFNCFQKNFPEIAQTFSANLKSAVVYCGSNGILYGSPYTTKNTTKGLKIVFRNCSSTTNVDLFEKIKSKKEFTAINNRGILVDKKLYYGDELKVVVFDD